jgi:hypothetical protein
MTRELDMSRTRRRSALCRMLLAIFVLFVAGCTTPDERRCAVNAINDNFRADYEIILKQNGSREFKVTRAEAYDAVRIGLARLGMTVETQDPVLGYVNVYAPAPRPLDLDEWKKAAETDLPRAREIIGPCVGMAGNFFTFEPEGLQTTIGATVIEVPGGTMISFTTRLREIAPPKTGFPRREYLPPTAVRMGLNKIWGEIDREFKATNRKP